MHIIRTHYSHHHKFMGTYIVNHIPHISYLLNSYILDADQDTLLVVLLLFQTSGNYEWCEFNVKTAINRRQFFRGDFSGRATPVRPPWAVDEHLFTSLCNQCGDCIEHCPTHIIKKGSGNFPIVNFKAGECLLCSDCVDICSTGALVNNDEQKPWQVIALINNTKCIAYQGTECRSCYDPCENHAINMTPRIGGVSIPIIDNKHCTGCGACYSVCPVQSITMQQLKEAA